MMTNVKREQRTQKRTPPVYSESCTGCGYCQLACSFVKTKVFNPAESLIKLHRIDGMERYSLSFTDECDGCGFCAKYCFHGALKA